MGLRDPDISRLLAAFRIEKADRVPHWELAIEPPTLEHILGRRCPGYNYVSLTPAQEDERTLADPDYRKATSWNLEPPDYLEVCQRCPNEAMGISLTHRATRGPRERGAIRGWQDLDKVRQPPSVEERVANLQRYIDVSHGGAVGVAPVFFGPLTGTYEALGVDGLAYMVYDDPKLVEHLLDFHTRDARSIAEAVADLDIDFTYVADDVAFNNGPVLRPHMMEELWLPRMAYILEPLRARGVPLALHCCGNSSAIIPWAIQLGFTAVNPVQPTCNDIFELKRQYGEQICFIGNIDCAGSLSFGTVDEVVRETREHIDRLAYNGGYVVASSHSITASVKPENYMAMVETTIQYGAYR